MFSDSQIDRSTIQAYLETEYRVLADKPFVLKIDVASPNLMRLHKKHQVQSSAFITAYNPLSESIDFAINQSHQSNLAHELKFRSLAFVDGIGQHLSNLWPGEPSFLVFGISREAAKALGLLYAQNAIVWCGFDATPQLVLLR